MALILPLLCFLYPSSSFSGFSEDLDIGDLETVISRHLNLYYISAYYYGLSTASEVFLIFTIQIYQFFSMFFGLHYLVTSLKYSILNTPEDSKCSIIPLNIILYFNIPQK